MSAKNSLIACLDEIAPVTRGRSFVRSTNPSTLTISKVVNHTSCATHKKSAEGEDGDQVQWRQTFSRHT